MFEKKREKRRKKFDLLPQYIKEKKKKNPYVKCFYYDGYLFTVDQARLTWYGTDGCRTRRNAYENISNFTFNVKRIGPMRFRDTRATIATR
jgi:hypothetical protein